MNTSYFNQKVVWITGASSGIGEELVRQLDRAGAQLILSARNVEKLNEIKSSLSNATKHMVVPLDLAHAENVQDLAQQIVQSYGRIDLLINNGGISQRATAHDTSLEVSRKIMEVNFFGNIALTKAVLPIFRQQQAGQILVISSIAGKFGFHLRSTYSASKHALMGYYESLVMEEMSYGLKVTVACPGKINTPISTNAVTGEGKVHGQMDHNQATGMPVSECVSQLLQALVKNKHEVLIGNKELLAVQLKRFVPWLFWKLIPKQSPT
ncbi:MAG: SDR family oxidoreductase [Flavobacteriales bacterium]